MVMEEQQSDMELDSERVPVPQVQKSVEDSRAETVNKTTSMSRGKPRLRKKALHSAILKQMEFYFSDANLSKDRFLNNLIKNDPYVDLSIFIKFNKIRELTTDINRITKALQASKMLSLSDDGTKVRRITQIKPKENTDECTIYIQNLPPDADHEMLNSILSQYGPVVYVSIPRYKNNRKIKGFAFVEFDTPESAQNCLKAFEKKGCVLPSHTAPDELLSITTFSDAEKDVALMGKTLNSNEKNAYIKNTEDTQESEDMETDKDISLENNEEKEHITINNSSELHETKNKKKIKKKRHRDSELSESGDLENQIDTEGIKSKKTKFEQSIDIRNNETEQINEKQNNVSLEDTQKKLNKCKKDVSESEEPVFDGDESEKITTDDNAVVTTEDEENTTDKKKKRRRKRRSKTEDVSYSLGQVMAKKDWKHLRNKYLELQRSKMKQLKQHLRKTRWNQWTNYDKNKPENNKLEKNQPEKNKPEKEENDEKKENDEKEETCKQDKTSMCRFSFVPGVIVKVEMDKPCADPKGLKMELKMNNSVQYVDIKESSSLAYVRCDTTENAQTFAQKSSEERRMTILEGEEEKTYWDKIAHDREEKLGKKIKSKQRGRNKLLKKAEKVLGKRIKFGEV